MKSSVYLIYRRFGDKVVVLFIAEVLYMSMLCSPTNSIFIPIYGCIVVRCIFAYILCICML